MRNALRAVLTMFLLAPAVPAGARVLDSAPDGFTVQSNAGIAAPPARVYRTLIDEVGHWWSPDHTFSHQASNLSLQGRAGGCFCEALPSGGDVRHMTVVYADPYRLLRLRGGLGPLQSLAVTGTLTFTFAPEGAGTAVTLVYTVGGYRPGGLAELAPEVDRVTSEQLERLKRYVETGSPGQSTGSR
jgi:uncharacterized protein YndB with AHSA1/START domain